MDNQEPITRRTSPWRRPGVVVLGLATLLAGAAGLAWATGVGPAALAHHGCGGGMAREMAAFHVHRVLGQVGASAAQEEQILAILDGQIAKHQAMRGVHDELHARVVAALSGAAVDRAALETVRTEALSRIDAGSKDVVEAFARAAEVLTPAQRLALADLAAEHLGSHQ
jgi:Spy/CpxP family protein refolding chaperone